MTELYGIDLEGFTIDHLKEIFENQEMLPSRLILKEQIQERLGKLESVGITNLDLLVKATGNKKKLTELAQKTGLSEDYLSILRREVNRYSPKTVKLDEFPDIDQEHIKLLAAENITQSKQLFNRARLVNDRLTLSETVNIPIEKIEELLKLSNLVRVNGVGPVFARMLIETGIDTLGALINSSPEELINKLYKVNAEKGYTQVTLKPRDIEFCLETARELPDVIE